MLSITGLVFMASCNNKDKTETMNESATEETTGTAETTTPMAENAEMAVTDIPQFSSAEVQKFVEDYAAYMNEVLKAQASKDTEKVAELQAHSVEWGQKAVGYMQKMTREERQDWDIWNKKMAERVQSQGQ